jgi:hypothetical protein
VLPSNLQESQISAQRTQVDEHAQGGAVTIPITSFKMWINAFIPQTINGYTRRVPGHAHLTMIPGPGIPLLGSQSYLHIANKTEPGGPLALTLFGYYTDQRSFSNRVHASSRMHSEVRLDLRPSPGGMTQWHKCDETVECDMVTGRTLAHRHGNTSRMTFTMGPRRVGTSHTILFSCAAHNPCVLPSAVVGDIDFAGTLTFDESRRVLELDCKVDDFPAFEAYAALNDGAGVPLFRLPPPPAHTVMNLPGPPRRPIRCRLQDTNGDAVFDTLTVL